jgi:hypothetical protein
MTHNERKEIIEVLVQDLSPKHKKNTFKLLDRILEDDVPLLVDPIPLTDDEAYQLAIKYVTPEGVLGRLFKLWLISVPIVLGILLIIIILLAS